MWDKLLETVQIMERSLLKAGRVRPKFLKPKRKLNEWRENWMSQQERKSGDSLNRHKQSTVEYNLY